MNATLKTFKFINFKVSTSNRLLFSITYIHKLKSVLIVSFALKWLLLTNKSVLNYILQ